MILQADITALVATYGLIVLAPVAVVEGPIVTVIASFLAAQGLLSLPGVFLCVVLADVVGDGLFYGLGRSGLGRLSPGWRQRLGLTPARLDGLVTAFETSAARILLAGKWTHAAGFAVLVAAGAARMPLWRFLWVNLLATIPKILLFMAIGYVFGSGHAQIAGWISGGSLILTAVALLAVLFWFRYRKGRRS